MEDSPCIDDTLEIFRRVHQEYDNVGIVIQARMRRSLADVRELGRLKANVRICKGIYLEPYAVAYTDAEIIRRNFTLLLEEMLSAGCYAAIATHDERLVWESYRLLERFAVPHDRYEFQMLLGVAASLRTLVRDDGHRVRVAAPFGPNWHAYSMRRLRKNPAITGYVLKSFLQGKG
jgi:proline dehydrogenase